MPDSAVDRAGGFVSDFMDGQDRCLIIALSLSHTICIYSKLHSEVFVMSLSALEVANNVLVC